MLNPLWKHQEDAIQRAKERDDFALFFGTGTGKSRTLLEILRYKYNENKRILRTILFTPIITQRNWLNEISLYTKIPKDKFFSLEGSGSNKVKTFDREAFDEKTDLELGTHHGKIFIVNYEVLLNKEFLESLMEWKPEVLILDEAHRCSRITAERTKTMIKISQAMETRKTKFKHVCHRYILTATPVMSTTLDMFALFKILDAGKSLGDNFFQYRAKFFYDKNSGMPKHKYFPNWQARKDMEPVLAKIIADKSAVAKKEDCLDLPPLVREKVFVEMSLPQKKVYTEMEKHLVSYLESGQAVVATLALTKALRLMQIMSGFYITDAGETHRFDKFPRMEALMELIEDNVEQSKIIIWCVFKENYKAIGDNLKAREINFVELHGDINQKEKYANMDAFNKDPSVRVAICHPAAASEGINLVSSNISIYYSRGFSMVADLQSEARNYRQGSQQHDKVTRIDIVTTKSLDEKILTAIETKQNISKMILGYKR